MAPLFFLPPMVGELFYGCLICGPWEGMGFITALIDNILGGAPCAGLGIRPRNLPYFSHDLFRSFLLPCHFRLPPRGFRKPLPPISRCHRFFDFSKSFPLARPLGGASFLWLVFSEHFIEGWLPTIDWYFCHNFLLWFRRTKPFMLKGHKGDSFSRPIASPDNHKKNHTKIIAYYCQSITLPPLVKAAVVTFC